MPPKKSASATAAAATAAAASSADAGGSGSKRRSRIQPIKDDRTRAVTLLKRRAGVFKKAFELSVLCQCDIGVIIFAPNGKLFEFTSAGDMDDLLLRYTEYLKPHEVKTNQDFAEGGDGQVGAPVQGESDDEADTVSAPPPVPASIVAPVAAAAPAALHHPSQHQHMSQRPVEAQMFGQQPHPSEHSHHSSYDLHQQPYLMRVQSQSDHQGNYSQSPPMTINPPQVPTGIAPAYQQVVPPLHPAGQFAPSEYQQQQQQQQQQGTPYLAPIASPPTSVMQQQVQHQQQHPDHGSFDEQQHHSRYEQAQQHHQNHQHQHHTSFPPPSVHNSTGQPGGGAAGGGTNGAPYDLFTSFHTASPQTYLPPLTSARPEFAPQNSLLAAAITAPLSSSQRRGSTDSRSHLTLHHDAFQNSSGIDPDLPTPILTPPSNNSANADADSTRPSTKRDRDAVSDNDRPQLAPIDVITSPTSDHPLPSPSNGPPTKRSKPNFARKTPFSLKLQIPGSSTPSASSQNQNPTTSSTGGSRTGRESASASPSMACPPADGRGPVLLEPNPSSAGAGGPGSSPVTRSPMNATPGGSHINPFTGAPLRTSNGGGGPNSAHPASAFPLFSANTPNPGNAGGYGAGGGGQATRKSPFVHFKGPSNGAPIPPIPSSYPAPISASAIPSPSGFFADRLPLPPPSSRGSGGSGTRPASSPVFPSPIPPIHGGYSSAFGPGGGHQQHQHPLSRVTAGGGDTPNSDSGGGSSPVDVKREAGAPFPRPVAAEGSRRAADEYEAEWRREKGLGHAVE